jgi:hypothetical protein
VQIRVLGTGQKRRQANSRIVVHAETCAVSRLHTDEFQELGRHAKTVGMFSKPEALKYFERLCALGEDEGAAGEFEIDTGGNEPVLQVALVVPVFRCIKYRAEGFKNAPVWEPSPRGVVFALPNIDPGNIRECRPKIGADTAEDGPGVEVQAAVSQLRMIDGTMRSDRAARIASLVANGLPGKNKV